MLNGKNKAKIKDNVGTIPIADLATNNTLNAKINEVKNQIPSITNSASTVDLTTVENKTPNISNLVKELTITQKLVKLKIKLLLIMIMINILLLKNLISNIRRFYCKISRSKFSKEK